MPVLRVLFAITVFILPLHAQERILDHNAHAWLAYFGDHPIGSSKWGVHLESQVRRHDLARTWQQFIVRPGVNYQPNAHVLLTAGYGFVRSSVYSEFAPAARPTHEHRIWEQALFRYKSGRVAWITRLRFENRFLGSAMPGSGFRYENRFRALQQATYQIRKPFYVTASNEIYSFVPPYVATSLFDQNRAYGGLGVNLKPGWRMEVGYLNQAQLQRSGKVLESNHTLVVQFFSAARFGH